MSSHFKALIVVWVVSVAVWVFFRKPLGAAIGARRYDNWRNIWLAYLTLSFLLTNYWIFLFVASVMVFTLSLAEREKPAIYLLLCTAAPVLGESIPGFAGINRFIEVSPQLALSFLVLLPALLVRDGMRPAARGLSAADRFFILWMILELFLATRAPSFTHMLRSAIESYLFVVPIYFVLSRWPKTLDDFRILAAAFIFPVIVLSAISVPEAVMRWHFFNSVHDYWFGDLDFSYTLRAGLLRTSTTVFNPGVWCVIAMAAFGLSLAFVNDKLKGVYKWTAFGLLALGMLTSLTRGPWIGAAVALAVFAMTGPKGFTNTVRLSVAGVVGLIALMFTPFADTILSLIPFIEANSATVGEGTIAYRRELLASGWDEMMRNPIFGSGDFLQSSGLQHMRQGQGIIDIVNTYLQIGLRSGLVGLAIFTGIFGAALLNIRAAMKSAARYDDTLAMYCRAVFATLVGVLVSIFTISNEGQIPIVYWGFAAFAIGLARVERAARESAPEKAPAPAATDDLTTGGGVPQFDWK